jgi:hypothetical protein
MLYKVLYTISYSRILKNADSATFLAHGDSQGNPLRGDSTTYTT